jgi:hypothetical protein
MNMYFVSSRWRNNTHVSPMRLFPSLEDAKAYANTLKEGEPVIYQLFSDREPLRISVKEKEQQK